MRVEFPSRRGVVVAADGVTLRLEQGEILGVVGESGAGKSTIANAVIGLLDPPGRLAAGEIRLRGARIDNLGLAALRKIRGRRIGMIFQDPLTSLDPLKTIEDQLTETIVMHLALSESAAAARAVALLDSVGIADAATRIKQYPHQFSGGMRQRVVIALSLCAEPEVLLADEPTTALDVSIQSQILDLMRTMVRERGLGMILITHDMGVIAQIADRVAVMYRGEVVETGAAAKVLGDPDHPYTRSLISAVPRVDRKTERFPLVEYIEAAAPPRKLDIRNHYLGQSRSFDDDDDDNDDDDNTIVAVENLRLRFATAASLFKSKRRYVDAVDDVSFDIRRGEVFGLVGESGSGKSTVARLICGIHAPLSGRIRINGNALDARGPRKALNRLRRQMQMVFQDPFSSLNGRMRVFDIVAEPIRFHRLARAASIHGIVLDLLDYVGLGARAAHKFPHEFSGGQRQRISIARALATRPRFLICDEPTSALDVSIQAQILNLLKDLQHELGLSMLFISHDLPVIRQMCDRVGVMKSGRLCELRETEALFTEPRHEYTRHLLELMPRFDILSARKPSGDTP
ncbi:MAG: dipeptide ABC transporter ATP-binding protein [bacterium]